MRLSTDGSREYTCDVRSDIEIDVETGSERVRGRPRPGKEVRKTLIMMNMVSFLSLLAG